MNKPGRNFALCLAVLAAITASHSARASTDTWTNPSDGDWFDPSNWSLDASPTSDDTAAFTGSSGYFVTFAGRAATINTLNLINSNAVVQLQEDGFYGSPTLELQNGTVGGLLFLQATDSFGPTLQIDNSLTVTSTGFLDVFPSGSADSSATAYINNGTLTNNGFISIETNTNINQTAINNNPGAGFSIGSSLRSVTAIQSSTTFNLNGGDLSLNDDSGLWIAAGTFNFAGGSINSSAEAPTIFQNPTTNGAIELYSSHLNTTIADGGGAVFTGFYNVTLDTNLAANTTLVMNANGFSGAVTLFTPATVANYGTITFRCNDGQSGYLTVGDGTGVIYNQGTINVTTNNPFGPGMAIEGSLVNNGTMNIDFDTHLLQNASNEATWNVAPGANVFMDGTRFNQDAGTLGNSGASAMIVSSGGFNFNGGKINLAVALYNSYLSTNTSDGHGFQFKAYGNTNLYGSFAPDTSLTVSDYSDIAGYHAGLLYVDDGMTNHGTIQLTPSSGSGSGVDLHIGDDTGTLTNSNGGEIDFIMKDGAFTDLYGNIFNSAGSKLVVTGAGSHTQFNGYIDNYGNFTLGSATTLVVASGYTYTAEFLSTNEIDGTILLDDGAAIILQPGASIHLAAGKMTTHGNVNVAHGASASVDSGGQIITSGGSVISNDGGSIVSGGGGNIIAGGGGNIIAGGGGNVISNDGGSLISQDGSGIVSGGGGNALPGASNALAKPFAQPAVSSAPTSSIIAQANGTITLNGGSLQADNLLEIDAGGTLTGHGNITVGSLTNAGIFNNAGSLSANSVTNSGTFIQSGPFTGPNTFTNSGNATLLTDTGSTLTSPLSILNTAGLLQLATPQHLNSLSITGGNVTLLPTNAARQTPAVVLKMSNLLIAPTSTLDITNHDLIIGNSNLTTVQTEILNGFGAGPGGAAITSSTALNGAPTFLVPLDATAFGITSWDNVPVDQPNSIVVKYTTFGDANIDGLVNADDFSVIISNLGTTTPGTADITTSILEGDVNLDGLVNADDFSVVITNLGSAPLFASPTNSSSVAFPSAAVPEPASLFLLGLGSACVLVKRKRCTM